LLLDRVIAEAGRHIEDYSAMALHAARSGLRAEEGAA